MSFTVWLFTGYLFNLQNPTKHIRNKQVRKICYEIITNVTKNQNMTANTYQMIEEVLKI